MSASREYSRAPCASWIAAQENAARVPARNAARRDTPASGNPKSRTATVRKLPTAGRSRTLTAEISIFWTTHRRSG